MKCQKCEKPATFHITELTGQTPHELHLCEDHAREYLTQSEDVEPTSPSNLVNVLAHQLKIGQTAEELARLDQKACPICGITFYEFRNQGRLGCPHDYVHFGSELEPLIVNIHGETEHRGKRPRRSPHGSEQQTELIRLRREMLESVEREDYERASELRDQIKMLEEARTDDEGTTQE